VSLFTIMKSLLKLFSTSWNVLISAKCLDQTTCQIVFCATLVLLCAISCMACIFNSLIKEGVVPSIWKRANVVPIPKTKPPKSVEQDLRPISLTPTISKIFESIGGRWILEAIGDKFDKKQFGAIKGRSTSHALVDIMHKWHKALDERNAIRVVFIDYVKAFDHVDHLTVIKKLSVLGVPLIILHWMDRQMDTVVHMTIDTVRCC